MCRILSSVLISGRVLISLLALLVLLPALLLPLLFCLSFFCPACARCAACHSSPPSPRFLDFSLLSLCVCSSFFRFCFACSARPPPRPFLRSSHSPLFPAFTLLLLCLLLCLPYLSSLCCSSCYLRGYFAALCFFLSICASFSWCSMSSLWLGWTLWRLWKRLRHPTGASAAEGACSAATPSSTAMI